MTLQNVNILTTWRLFLKKISKNECLLHLSCLIVVFETSKKNNDVDPDQKVLNGIDKRNSVGNTLLNPGFDRLKQMADSAKIPLYVCLHATLPEFNAGKYDEQGEEIISWCNQHNVFLVKDLEEGLTDKMFRDNIHINDMGQRLEAQIMKKYIK